MLNVFRHWVEFHYYDFEREPKLLAMLEEFVGSIRSRSMQKWVTSIHRALKKVCALCTCARDLVFGDITDPASNFKMGEGEYKVAT